MASIPDCIERWLDTLEGVRDGRGQLKRNLAGSSVYGEGHTLYSYGRHFPLAEWYPAGVYRDPASGRIARRRSPLFLLNGDRVSVSTARHQAETRGSVNRRTGHLGAGVLILPFSALESARIVRGTVTPLEIRADRWETVHESAASLEGVPEYHRTSPEWVSADTLEGVPDEVSARGWSEMPRYNRRSQYRDTGTGRYHWPVVHTLEPESDGRYHWSREVHRLGDSVFTAAVAETVRRSREWTVRDVIRTAAEYVSADAYETRAYRTGSYGRTFRDGELIRLAGRRLESLELAPIVETGQVHRRRRFISAFDVNEPAPLYYLATLPAASRAASVETAVQDLAPAAVHAAMARGRDVRRQGDVFFIGTDLADETVYAQSRRRARLTQWTRGAAAKPGEAGYFLPTSPAAWKRMRRETRRLYIAGAESAASRDIRPGYTGPHPTIGRGHAKRYRRTLAELERTLAAKRRLARAAVLQGNGAAARIGRYDVAGARDRLERFRGEHYRDAYRRAAIGAGVAADRWADSFRIAYDRHNGRPSLEARRAAIRSALMVHGTAHTATEVVHASGGRVYVRGIVRHVPELAGERRGRDHVNLKLEPGRWYLAVRNTVPRSRDTTGR